MNQFEKILSEAEMLYRLNDTDEALKKYLLLYKIRPRRIEPYVQIGSIYGQKRMHEDAIRWLMKGQKLAPNSEPVNFMLGQVYFHKGDIEKAKTYLLKAVNINKQNEGAVHYLTQIYLAEGNETALFELLDEVIELHAYNAQFHFLYGATISNCYDPDDQELQNIAVSSMEKAHSLGFRKPELLFYLGLAHFNLHEFKKALPYFKQFYQYKKDDQVLEMIMLCWYGLNEIDKAREYAEELASRGSNQASDLLKKLS